MAKPHRRSRSAARRVRRRAAPRPLSAAPLHARLTALRKAKVPSARLAPFTGYRYSLASRGLLEFLERNGLATSPPDPCDVADYLAFRACGLRDENGDLVEGADGRPVQAPIVPGSVHQEAAGIRDWCLNAGHTNVCADPVVDYTSRGVALGWGRAGRPKVAATIPEVRRMVTRWPDPPLVVCQDRAILALGQLGVPTPQATAFNAEDVVEEDNAEDGLTVNLPAVLRRTGRGGRVDLPARTLQLRHHPEPLLCAVCNIRRARHLAVNVDTPLLASTVVDGAPYPTPTCHERIQEACARAGVPFQARPHVGAGLNEAQLFRVSAWLSLDFVKFVRDRAFILVTFASGRRGGEIRRLKLDQLFEREAFDPNDRHGYRIRFPLTKTDRDGRNVQWVGLLRERDAQMCATEALDGWLEISGIGDPEGNPVTSQVAVGERFVFRNVEAGMANKPLGANTVNDFLTQRANAAGIRGRWTTYVLRRGYINQAIDQGNDLVSIANRSGHTPTTLYRYYYVPRRVTDRFAPRAVGL